MAGAGFKSFSAGDVLTAADVNDYLMQGVLVFADSAARGSAIASPVEGQMSYLSDTDALEVYDGSDWTAVSGSLGGAAISDTPTRDDVLAAFLVIKD